MLALGRYARAFQTSAAAAVSKRHLSAAANNGGWEKKTRGIAWYDQTRVSPGSTVQNACPLDLLHPGIHVKLELSSFFCVKGKDDYG